MTINQAAELVRVFWPKDVQKLFHDKIMLNYPEKKWYLLLIGSPNCLLKTSELSKKHSNKLED